MFGRRGANFLTQPSFANQIPSKQWSLLGGCQCLPLTLKHGNLCLSVTSTSHINNYFIGALNTKANFLFWSKLSWLFNMIAQIYKLGSKNWIPSITIEQTIESEWKIYEINKSLQWFHTTKHLLSFLNCTMMVVFSPNWRTCWHMQCLSIKPCTQHRRTWEYVFIARLFCFALVPGKVIGAQNQRLTIPSQCRNFKKLWTMFSLTRHRVWIFFLPNI